MPSSSPLENAKPISLLTLNGKTRKLTKKDFVSFGENIGLDKRNINNINSIISKKEEMKAFVKSSLLDKQSIDKYVSEIDAKCSIFE